MVRSAMLSISKLRDKKKGQGRVRRGRGQGQRVRGQVPDSIIPCEYLILRIGLELIWGDVGI